MSSAELIKVEVPSSDDFPVSLEYFRHNYMMVQSWCGDFDEKTAEAGYARYLEHCKKFEQHK